MPVTLRHVAAVVAWCTQSAEKHFDDHDLYALTDRNPTEVGSDQSTLRSDRVLYPA